MKKQSCALLLILFFLLSPSRVWAARSLSIIGDKTSLYGEEQITLTASISGFTTGEKIFIKGAFYKEGTANYFGFTKSDENWIRNGESAAIQREVTIGVWDLQSIVKSDYVDTGFSGKGVYNLKLGFYYQTASGLSSVNWSTNSLNLELDMPSPTPTPIENKTVEAVRIVSPTLSPTLIPKITSKPTEGLIFAKIAEEIRSASEYAKFKNEVELSRETKTKVLGAKTMPDFTGYWILSGFILILVSVIWLAGKYFDFQEIYESIKNKIS